MVIGNVGLISLIIQGIYVTELTLKFKILGFKLFGVMEVFINVNKIVLL